MRRRRDPDRRQLGPRSEGLDFQRRLPSPHPRGVHVQAGLHDGARKFQGRRVRFIWSLVVQAERSCWKVRQMLVFSLYGYFH